MRLEDLKVGMRVRVGEDLSIGRHWWNHIGTIESINGVVYIEMEDVILLDYPSRFVWSFSIASVEFLTPIPLTPEQEDQKRRKEHTEKYL